MTKEAISDVYQKALKQLSTIYDKREADLILHYLFEDMWQIRHPQGNQSIFDNTQYVVFEQCFDQLMKQEPWQYVVGQADFYGLKFKVDESVLIPRPETEELVHLLIDKNNVAEPRIWDIGTGSGCIAVSLSKHIQGSTVFASDISDKALNMAQQNSDLLATPVHFFKHDMSDRLSTLHQFIDQGLDMIISNPPYIGQNEKEHMRDNVLQYEPHLALFVNGEDVLIHYRDVAYWAEQYLNKKGIVCVEINTHYAEACLAIFQDKGFTSSIINDMYGKPRMILGRRSN